MCGEDLRGGVRSLSPLQRQNHRECRAFPKHAGNVNAPLVVFNNAARQRQSQASAVTLGRVERAKNVGELIGRNAAAVIGHFDDCRVAFVSEEGLDPYRTDIPKVRTTDDYLRERGRDSSGR